MTILLHLKTLKFREVIEVFQTHRINNCVGLGVKPGPSNKESALSLAGYAASRSLWRAQGSFAMKQASKRAAAGSRAGSSNKSGLMMIEYLVCSELFHTGELISTSQVELYWQVWLK